MSRCDCNECKDIREAHYTYPEEAIAKHMATVQAEMEESVAEFQRVLRWAEVGPKLLRVLVEASDAGVLKDKITYCVGLEERVSEVIREAEAIQ